MPDITISINEELLKEGQKYARAHHISMNKLIRNSLEYTLKHPQKDWLDECFELMDKANCNSLGVHWKREDVYDV